MSQQHRDLSFHTVKQLLAMLLYELHRRRSELMLYHSCLNRCTICFVQWIVLMMRFCSSNKVTVVYISAYVSSLPRGRPPKIEVRHQGSEPTLLRTTIHRFCQILTPDYQATVFDTQHCVHMIQFERCLCLSCQEPTRLHNVFDVAPVQLMLC